jgi:arginase
MRILETLGVSACLGGPISACGDAAEMLREEWEHFDSLPGLLKLHWKMLQPEQGNSTETQLCKLNNSISAFTEYWVKQHKPFLVIGGDHSCAMGTWAGVLNALEPGKRFGLIWLDAHMDAHTFNTTPSGNIHGMPLSALLGKADGKLQHLLPTIKAIQPENLILLGTRSYESAEHELLKQADVTIVFAEQIQDFEHLLVHAVEKLNHSCDVIGISIDLDFIRPEDAPGVETPVAGGIAARALLNALAQIKQQPKICGLELSEFNPNNDVDHQTLHLMKNIVETFYG